MSGLPSGPLSSRVADFVQFPRCNPFFLDRNCSCQRRHVLGQFRFADFTSIEAGNRTWRSAIGPGNPFPNCFPLYLPVIFHHYFNHWQG